MPNKLPRQITSLSGMFYGAEKFNQEISNWDVTSVTDMSWMFSGAKSFNQDISSWDVTNVTNMSRMFQGALIFNQDLSEWNVAEVKYWEGFARSSGFATNHKSDPNFWKEYFLKGYKIKRKTHHFSMRFSFLK